MRILMTEFRRNFEKPKKLPNFDFKSHDLPRAAETRSSKSGDEISTEKPTYRDTRTHDTTIHTTVKPPVVHETIRSIETEIVNTELTVHQHVHHYVHRIQPVIVSSVEEEGLAHDILGQGQPPTGDAMYRDPTMDAKRTSNDICRLCGAEGNLLSHIGTLKRRNNEASSTGACPVCGSNNGVGRDTNLKKGNTESERERVLRGDMTGQDGERSKWGFGANPTDRTPKATGAAEVEGDLTRGIRGMKISQ